MYIFFSIRVQYGPVEINYILICKAVDGVIDTCIKIARMVRRGAAVYESRTVRYGADFGFW